MFNNTLIKKILIKILSYILNKATGNIRNTYKSESFRVNILRKALAYYNLHGYHSVLAKKLTHTRSSFETYQVENRHPPFPS